MKQQKNVNERYIRHIWKKKLFNEDGLKTLDGSSLKIIFPGFGNDDGGPDFKRTKIQLSDTIYEGDVEIHRDISDWLLHSHSGNPKYNNTVLHVVLYSHSSFIPTFTHNGRKVPVLVLEDFLDKPLADIWEEAIVEEREERSKTIACFDQNKKIALDKKFTWLERLGYRKLESRIKHLEDRLRKYIELDNIAKSKSSGESIDRISGLIPIVDRLKERKFWDQLIFEGLMEGMGYSKNREPFLKLSQFLPLVYFHQNIDLNNSSANIKIQALLFGVAGLIPPINEINDDDTINYLNNLNAYWNNFDYQGSKLNKSEWYFFRLRPQNFPTVRLAGISYLLPSLIQGTILRNSLQKIRQYKNNLEETIQFFSSLLTIEAEGYWCSHFNFSAETRKETKTLIGQNRIDDIIINTLIPVLILYSRIFKELRTEKSAMSLYHLYPRLSDNDTSRILIDQLLEGNSLKTAKQQQGAIHLYKYYCTEKRCSRCDIGKMVRGIETETEEFVSINN